MELAMKGMLRTVGVEPPKLHDVGGLLLEHQERFPREVPAQLDELAGISRTLREDRELAFYGEVDFIPTEEYSLVDAQQACDGAAKVLDAARRVIERL